VVQRDDLLGQALLLFHRIGGRSQCGTEGVGVLLRPERRQTRIVGIESSPMDISFPNCVCAFSAMPT